MSRSLLEIGSVCRPHGLRGELRVKLHDPSSDALDVVEHLWTEKDREKPQQWRVKWCRGEANGFYVVAVDGIADRTAAESFTGQKIIADRAETPKIDAGEGLCARLPGR